MTKPYPLTFSPILLAKVWGGDRLARFGKPIRPGDTIGESWEIADLADTAASGAGGGAQRSVIAAGALAGRTLADALREWGPALLGAARPAEGGGFPLLVKLLDARENLSVQVHPSPAYARAHAGARLKTECWYILDSQPGSVIYKGVRPGIDRARFAAAIRDGSVVEHLVAVPATPGDCHNLPSGTCHALGAGVLVAEVQTPSDTTFRVYDWGRVGRALHVEESLECIDFGPAPPAIRMKSPSGGRGGALRTEYFTVWHAGLSPEADQPVSPGGECAAVIVLGGSGSLYSESGGFAPIDLAVGMTVLVPAAVAASATIEAGETTRLECLVAALPAG